MIKEIIVVEGKTDTAKLKKIFPEVETFETNGTNFSINEINILKKLNDSRGIICFFDPDKNGKIIRNKINNFIPNAKHAFISKQDIKDKSKKIGVAEACEKEIKESLKNLVTFSKNIDESITWHEYLSLALNTNEKRLALCKKLNICYLNHKQLFKVLNNLKLTNTDISKIINNLEKEKNEQ
ncbi:MAG: ribonuclease M5 [Mycoplasmoidaceae bacterium]